MKYELRKLSVNDGSDIYNMLQEIPKDENGFTNAMNGVSYDSFKKWLIKKDEGSKTKELVDGWKVPSTFYWLYVNNRLVGIGKLRHFLTDKLREEGGHIGYAIRPKERKKGYGTKILEMLIDEAKNKNIDKILLTVRNENIYSIKVCLNNGGVISYSNDIRSYIWVN